MPDVELGSESISSTSSFSINRGTSSRSGDFQKQLVVEREASGDAPCSHPAVKGCWFGL
jgi:hypothetical protein